MAAPRIAMPEMGNDLFRRYMKGKYIRCLKRAGAVVELLSGDGSAEQIEKYVDSHDGFLFPGGPDIEPALYGADRQPACGKPNETRDRFELPFLRAVIAAKKPVFCICRGMQLLNVACGGTLTQDIAGIQKEKHMDFRHRARATHEVRILPGSLLSNIEGADLIRVNSMHHQAVGELGEGLTAEAWSLDEFIEAVELEEHPFCLGVQWHPEHIAARTPQQQALFERFVDACISCV